jgi:hypothetical protein
MADKRTTSTCRVSRNYGSRLLEACRSVQHCNGIALNFTVVKLYKGETNNTYSPC